MKKRLVVITFMICNINTVRNYDLAIVELQIKQVYLRACLAEGREGEKNKGEGKDAFHTANVAKESNIPLCTLPLLFRRIYLWED